MVCGRPCACKLSMCSLSAVDLTNTVLASRQHQYHRHLPESRSWKGCWLRMESSCRAPQRPRATPRHTVIVAVPAPFRAPNPTQVLLTVGCSWTRLRLQPHGYATCRCHSQSLLEACRLWHHQRRQRGRALVHRLNGRPFQAASLSFPLLGQITRMQGFSLTTITARGR